MFVGQAVFLLGLANQLARCSTLSICSLVSPPTVAGQEHRLALHQKRTRKRRKRARCLHCAAVALAVSGRAICEADDLDDGATPAGTPTAVGGEVVVLSDWLDKARQKGRVEVISSFEDQRGGRRKSSPPHRFQELIQVGTAVLQFTCDYSRA